MIFVKHRVCILFAILLWGCSFSHEMQAQSAAKYTKYVYVGPKEAKNETLIDVALDCKIGCYRGVIKFLRYENGDFKLIAYSYCTNDSYYAKDKDKEILWISCRYLYSKTCETNEIDFSRGWSTALEFQKVECLKPYFSLISEDFMEVSNERKIQMLDSFIHVHKKSGDYDILNEKEGKELNAIFHDKTNGFDFIGKKVGFVGSVGKPGEKGYFLYKTFFLPESLQNATLYLFDEQQKIDSGGYDAAIVYKGTEHIPIEDVIKILKHD